jgi:hypothetical protein
MDFFQSHQTVPKRCYLTFFHIPERSIALVKRLAGSPKGAEIDPNLPHANKSVTSGSTRILIYIDGLLSVAPTVPKPLLSYLLPYSRTFNCTSKTTGSPKGAEIDPNLHANKSVTPGSTRILIYIDGLLSVAPTVPKPLLSSSIFPERSIALVKRLAGSPKELKLIQPAPR